MSLQHSLYQVMRLLTDNAVNTKRAALMLYALQIAASNLKRLHQETHEIAESANTAQEKSWLKELLDALHLPETPEELAAQASAAFGHDPAMSSLPWQPVASPAEIAGPSEPHK